MEPILPEGSWILGSVRISQDRVWFAVTVVGIALALTAVYRLTRFGLITRAAAETEKGAHVSGISPERVATFNWMISAAVAAISGILIAPIVPLTPFGNTLFIVPALAAAVIGRFEPMILAVIGGLAIGMLQSELAYPNGQVSWLPTSGVAEMVPLLLILVVFVARAKPLPSRGVIIQQGIGMFDVNTSMSEGERVWTRARNRFRFAAPGHFRNCGRRADEKGTGMLGGPNEEPTNVQVHRANSSGGGDRAAGCVDRPRDRRCRPRPARRS